MNPTRRSFLKTSLGAALLSFAPRPPAFLSRCAALAGERSGGTSSQERILVVLQLSGGNDGLNTVVPYEDDAYGRSRRTLRLKASQVLKIGGAGGSVRPVQPGQPGESRPSGDADEQSRSGPALGFHPEMPAFLRLYEKGYLSIVQGVGYPRSSRDHDEALRDWQTARPGETTAQTGWLGRASDRLRCSGRGGEHDVPSLFAGEIEQPFGLHAAGAAVPSIARPEDCCLRAGAAKEGGDAPRGRLETLAKLDRTGPGSPLLESIRRATLEAHAASRRIEALLAQDRARAPGSPDYPNFPLGQTLRSVASLIRAELGIRVFFAELGGGGIGGFDNHANQGANHGALLRQLSESVAAFVEELERDRLLGRVLLMTFSEFGRTVGENGRRGTDHGAAAPVFLAGGRVKGGLVGAHPSLTDLEGDAQKPHTDFRRLYATVLDRWIGVESEPILGGKYEVVDVVKG